jgi:transcriptional regulator with XRE-family HTH domain
MADASPTVRQRELGRRLRQLRGEQGLTVEDVANRLMCSTAKISRLETGARPPNLRDVRDLCTLYGVDAAAAAELMKLAREAREPSWWSQYDDLSLDPYVGFEQEAVAITVYSMYYVHALVQTEEYARRIIKDIAPKIDPEIHRQRVEARLRRQQLLDGDKPPRYRLLLDEAVLRRPVGGPALMAAQLAKILGLVAAGKATVQVVPFEVGAYSVADIGFTLLEFSELPALVFTEQFNGMTFSDREKDVARYRESIEHVRDAALSPRESIQLMQQVQNAYAAEGPSSAGNREMS